MDVNPIAVGALSKDKVDGYYNQNDSQLLVRSECLLVDDLNPVIRVRTDTKL